MRMLDLATRVVWIVLAAVVAGGNSASAGDVHVVGPGGDFATVAAAVSLSADGDVVIVKATPVNVIIIDGKSLSVVADAATKPKLASVVVRNLAAAQQVVIRGFAIASPNPTTSPATTIRVEACDGAVRIEDCSTAPALNDFPDTSVGALVVSSTNVSFVRCDIRGGEGWFGASIFPGGFPPNQGAAGIRIVESRVAILDCEVRGGDGGKVTDDDEEYAYDATQGGPAIRILSGEAIVSGTMLRGALPGSPTCYFHYYTGLVCGSPANGANCIDNPGGAVIAFDNDFQPGTPKGRVSLEPIEIVNARARSLTAPHLAAPNSNATLEFDGVPGDLGLAFGGLGPAYSPFPGALQGVMLVTVPLAFGPIVFPPTNVSGDPVTALVALPVIAPSAEGLAVHFQAATLDIATNRIVLSSPSVLTIASP